MRKVLVMEDEEYIREFVVINLKRSGYDVIEADTGQKAMEYIDTVPTDLRSANTSVSAAKQWEF